MELVPGSNFSRIPFALCKRFRYFPGTPQQYTESPVQSNRAFFFSGKLEKEMTDEEFIRITTARREEAHTKALADWERKGCFPKFLSEEELDEIAQGLHDHQMLPIIGAASRFEMPIGCAISFTAQRKD
jgi:hypothetical protein